MFFWNLLTSTDSNASTNGDFGTWLMLGGAIILIVVMMVFNGRSQRKRQQEMQETLNALKPGCKVKTIGGVCGVVVEVCNEDNTFVMETGSEEFGKSYIKFDKQAIYQTDAKKEPVAVEETTEAVATEETAEPEVEAPVFEEEAIAPVVAADALAEEFSEESESVESEESVESKESVEAEEVAEIEATEENAESEE